MRPGPRPLSIADWYVENPMYGSARKPCFSRGGGAGGGEPGG